MIWLIATPRPANAVPNPSIAVRWLLRVSESKVLKKSSSSIDSVEFFSGIVSPAV